jgi:hypothetical protein
MTYDPDLHVTAGELRGMGVPIPEDIPDCGWVPKESFRVGLGDPKQRKDGEWPLDITVTYIFTEPFRWVAGTFTINQLDAREPH